MRVTFDLTVPVVVVITDHGYGGPFDATRKAVAVFDSAEAAIAALAEKGFSVDWNGNPARPDGQYYHTDLPQRRGMSTIAYSLVEPSTPLPRNVIP